MVLSTLDTLTTAIDELLALDADSIDDTGLHELVVELGRQSSRLEAAWCGVIRSWDRRQIWADNGSKAPGARLARDTHLRKSDANRLVRRGRALGSMPLAAAAYQAGEINGDHIDLIATCNTSWPNADFAESEQMLVNSCTTAWFDNATRAVDYWKQLADRDGADTRALDHREGRHASIATGWRGEVVLNGVFDPVSGEIFKTELDRICEQLRRQDECEGTLRTVQQRRADALVEMAMRSATAPADGLRPRPLFTVTIGIDPFSWLCETAAGTVIAPSLLVPLLGDADIDASSMTHRTARSKPLTGAASSGRSGASSRYATGTASTSRVVTSRHRSVTSITSCRGARPGSRASATASSCAPPTIASPRTTATAHHSPRSNDTATPWRCRPTPIRPGPQATPAPAPRLRRERHPKPAERRPDHRDDSSRYREKSWPRRLLRLIGYRGAGHRAFRRRHRAGGHDDTILR